MSPEAEILAKAGVNIPTIFLPPANADWPRWAVVACDQYSSEHEYWERVALHIGEAPSTLRLVFPECYLEEPGKAERVWGIQATMREYLARGVIRPAIEGFILVERTSPLESAPRIGLVMAVDLERYEYGKESRSLIRPTEGTIVERLPPRMDIRRSAPLELPHIMLLIDDAARSVIEPLYAKRNKLPALYDFELMEGSGHVRGFAVSTPALFSQIGNALLELDDPAAFKSKYGSDNVLLFAVGDGNHSLATAKAIWDETKKAQPSGADLANHPARYALVELVNIYDEGLPFHPIHRVLFGADGADLLAAMLGRGWSMDDAPFERATAWVDAKAPHGEHRFAWISGSGSGTVLAKTADAKLATSTMQEFLDKYLREHPKAGIDYIHGSESLATLARKSGNFGLYLPPVDKASFFGTVIRDGVMPRKTFSMGEAPEKRFYIESRKIIP